MATVNQKDVTWVKKGDMVKGKKVTKGYLALRSDKSKAFSGTVTGVKSGSTANKAGVATYAGGRNVVATAARKQAASGSSAAAGIKVRNASTSNAPTYNPGAMTKREKDARSASKTTLQKAREANPYLGGRAAGIAKKKNGSYTTAAGVSSTTARGTLAKKKAIDKKNEGRDSAVLATMALAPAALIGGGGGAAAGGLKFLARPALTAGRGRAALPSASRAAIQAGSKPKAIAGRVVPKSVGPQGAAKNTPSVAKPMTNAQKAKAAKPGTRPENMNASEKAARGREMKRDAAGDRFSARSAAAKKGAATRARNKANAQRAAKNQASLKTLDKGKK